MPPNAAPGRIPSTAIVVSPSGFSPNNRAGKDRVFVPGALALDAGRILWHMLDLVPDRYRRIPDSMLDDFLTLKDKPDAAILRFAKRFGPLGLDDTGLPHALRGKPWATTQEYPPGIFGKAAPDTLYVESCDDWRHYARGADALVTAAAWLHLGDFEAVRSQIKQFVFWFRYYEGRGETPNPEAILRLVAAFKVQNAFNAPSGRVSKAEKRAAAETAIQDEVNTWLRAGDVRMSVWSTQGFWTMVPAPTAITNLFGHLAVRIAKRMVDAAALPICAGCGSAYAPRERMPSKTRRAWCPLCVANGTRDKLIKRSQREEKRNGKA